jgi:hypothetical protein
LQVTRCIVVQFFGISKVDAEQNQNANSVLSILHILNTVEKHIRTNTVWTSVERTLGQRAYQSGHWLRTEQV